MNCSSVQQLTRSIFHIETDRMAKESNGYMGGWKLVHLVPCRHYSSGRNLCGWMKEEAELAASVAPDAESHTLFLLDGLDEFTGQWPSEIVRIFKDLPERID